MDFTQIKERNIMWLINFVMDNVNCFLQRNVRGIEDINLYFSQSIHHIYGFGSMITINGFLKRFKSSEEKSIQFYVSDNHVTNQNQASFTLEVPKNDYDKIINKFKFLNTRKDIIFLDTPFPRDRIDFGNIHCKYTMCQKCSMLLEGDTGIPKHTNSNIYGDFCPVCHKCKTCNKKFSKDRPQIEQEWLIRKLKKEG